MTVQFFATENRFNMGILKYKLPLIVIVAHKSSIVNRQFGVKNCYVWFWGHVPLRMPSDYYASGYVITFGDSELSNR